MCNSKSISEYTPRRTMGSDRKRYQGNKTHKTGSSYSHSRQKEQKMKIVFILIFMFLLVIIILAPFYLMPLISVINRIPLLSLFLTFVGFSFVFIFLFYINRVTEIEKRKKIKSALMRDIMVFTCPICHCQNLRKAKFCNECGIVLTKSSDQKKEKGKMSIFRRSRPLPEVVKLGKIAHQIQHKNATCDECGFEYSTTLINCPVCQAKRIECLICKRILSYEDDIAFCFYCNTLFHYSHLMEYVKMKGKCPICHKILLNSEVVRKHHPTDK